MKTIPTASSSCLPRSGCAYTWIDSASQGHVVAVEAGVRQSTGSKLKLQGVTGDTSFADEVEIALTAPTDEGNDH
eukprot:3903250-Rhodomonas_salina.1